MSTTPPTTKPPQPGDLVRLMSGGPLMTFVRLTDDKPPEAYCVWFATDGTAQAGNFALHTLITGR